MNVRAIRLAAWMILSATVLLVLGNVWLSILNFDVDEAGVARTISFVLSDLLLFNLLSLVFVAFGLLVIFRRPRNPIGWIIVGASILGAASDFVENYGIYALFTAPDRIPGGETMAWLSNWIYVPVIFAAPAMLFLLFPNGHLLSRRWLPVFWLVILTSCATIVGAIFDPVLDDTPFEGVANPFGLHLPGLLGAVGSFGWPGMALSFIVAAIAMIVRLRRSQGVERQQLKWLAAAAAVLPLASGAGVLSYILGYEMFGGVVTTYAFVPILFAAGYAILRYRLYDIDFIINRALVYGALTISLVLVYLGGVVSLQYILRALTGGGSQLAIVASTLAIAALFNPLRRRIQATIDRRFYRGKYDARRTLDDFSVRLRNEVDVDDLSRDLVGVVRDTVRPEYISLWLRPLEKR